MTEQDMVASLASEKVAKLRKVFDNWNKILEGNGLRVSESKTEYMFLPFSDPLDIMVREHP